MSDYIANNILNILNDNKIDMVNAKILILGITFKEDCPIQGILGGKPY